MSTYALALGLAQAADPQVHHSIWHNVAASLPSDPVSLFTLALLLGVGGLAVVAGMRSNGSDSKGGDGLST